MESVGDGGRLLGMIEGIERTNSGWEKVMMIEYIVI